MKYRIEIKLSNASFDHGYEGWEIARILRGLAKECDEQGVGIEKSLRDINGNTVGVAKKRR